MYTRIAFASLLASAIAAPTQLVAKDAQYVSYAGDGSAAAGWPTIEQWAKFDDIWSGYEKIIKGSCGPYKLDNTSDEEAKQMKDAIHKVADANKVDARVVLAKILQESKGCVRVWKTVSPDGKVINPGLMQDYNGKHMCNTATGESGVLKTPGTAQTPCPPAEIEGMIQDGVVGADPSDPGNNSLLTTLKAAGGNDAQAYYRAARLYNSGLSSLPNGKTQDITVGGATASYPADIANRLMGVVFDKTSWVAGAAPKGPASSAPKPSAPAASPSAPAKASATAAQSNKIQDQPAQSTAVVQATSTAHVTATSVVPSAPAAPVATGGATGGAPTTCGKDGELTCSADGKQFGLCSGGKAATMINVAPGTKCSGGQIVAASA